MLRDLCVHIFFHEQHFMGQYDFQILMNSVFMCLLTFSRCIYGKIVFVVILNLFDSFGRVYIVLPADSYTRLKNSTE